MPIVTSNKIPRMERLRRAEASWLLGMAIEDVARIHQLRRDVVTKMRKGWIEKLRDNGYVGWKVTRTMDTLDNKAGRPMALSSADLIKIREYRANGRTIKSLARQYKVSYSTMRRAIVPKVED